jgi:hypothetical protein
MNNNLVEISRQKAIQRYVRAIDKGDLEEIINVLDQATTDPALDLMLVEINQAVEQEEGLTVFAKDTVFVRQLIHQHFNSDIMSDEPDVQPLTIGEVAARMQAARNVPTTDQSIHKTLLHFSTPLPEFLNIQAIRKLATELQVDASEKFWRVFRDTAIMMGIGRGQAQMAAARKQKARKSGTEKTNSRNKK